MSNLPIVVMISGPQWAPMLLVLVLLQSVSQALASDKHLYTLYTSYTSQRLRSWASEHNTPIHVHVHVHKTGGTSITKMALTHYHEANANAYRVRRRTQCNQRYEIECTVYGRKDFCCWSDRNETDRVEWVRRTQKRFVRLECEGVPRWHDISANGTFFYSLVVRHPLERMLSHAQHAVNDKLHARGIRLQTIDKRAAMIVALTQRKWGGDNLLTKLLAGYRQPQMMQDGDLTCVDYRRAQEVLCAIPLVLVLPTLDTQMMMLKCAMGWTESRKDVVHANQQIWEGVVELRRQLKHDYEQWARETQKYDISLYQDALLVSMWNIDETLRVCRSSALTEREIASLREARHAIRQLYKTVAPIPSVCKEGVL